jgi:peroxiredoxin
MSAAPGPQPSYIHLSAGDPAPWFRQRTSTGEVVFLDKMAGRYIVLCFFLTASDAAGSAAVRALEEHRTLFDDRAFSFFGITMDRADDSSGRLARGGTGIRYVLDFDAALSRAYGSIPRETAVTTAPVRRFWLVLDPMLRVLNVVAFAQDGSDRARIFQYLEALPPPGRFGGVELQAPVLVLPNVFEPELCRRLISLYEERGGTESGFMREQEGKTVLVLDPRHKRRRDCTLESQEFIEDTKRRIARRVIPEIAKAYQFHATRIERFIVACYSAEDGGHFNVHRDNTTKGTAHRRFAVSLNLNEDYDGGDIVFPEFGPKGFRPPAGGAAVFSCSLLHAAKAVTRGNRYVFLPFLYDEAASAIREKNNAFLDPAIGQYRA